MAFQKILQYLLLSVSLPVLSACSPSGNVPSNPLPANRPPVLSGSPPPNAMLDSIYSFKPGSSDPDGDPVSFSIVNLPSWAVFDNNTGALTGIPSMQHIGTYENITISISDGQSDVELPVFNIEVVPSANGSLSLSWTPPTQSADGTVLNDLASYRIRWGTQSGDHPNLRSVSNPGVSRFVVDGLAAGNYFFLLSAVDSSNNESIASNEASGTVP